jgi:peptidoglycan/LPS O-acetylase OafA/YrhL
VAALAFAFTSHKAGLLAALSALTFTINYAIIYVHPTGIFDHLWSLCVEEHGYLILALLAWAVSRQERLATVLLFVAGAVAMANGIAQNAVTGAWFVDVSWRTDVQVAPLFLAGAIFLVARKLPRLQVPWLSPLCLVLGITAKLAFTPVWIQFGLGTLFLAFAVATLDSAATVIQRALEPAILRQIGLWSFSVYLWQQPFYIIAKDAGASPVLMLTAAVCCGLLSFYLVEDPARRRINRGWTPGRKPLASA